MIKELRIYWRLRPYINQMKGLSGMKFSTQLIGQAALIALQACNQIYDLVPGKYKNVMAGLMLILQGILAMRGLYVNPDGTPAATPYIKNKVDKLKLPGLLILGLILLPSGHALAQDLPSAAVAAGVGLNQNSTPQVQGWATYAKQVPGKIFLLSTCDITAVPGSTGTLPKLQFQFRPGLAYPLFQIGGLTFLGMGEAGLSATGETVGGSFGGGGIAMVRFKTSWAILGVMRVVRNNISGTQFVPEIGIAYGR
jgi:hypothetical protein